MAGGSDAQTTVQSMPSWAEPYAQSYLQRSAQVADTPYQQYGGTRTAGLNAQQYGALDAIQSRALQGDPTMSAGADYLNRTLGNGVVGATANPAGYLQGVGEASRVTPQANSYGFIPTNQQAAAQVSAASNPYGYISTQGMSAPQVSEQRNPYAGSNPYLQQNIDAALSDMARNYNMTTAPQLDRLAAQSGSFGNSGVQQMQLEAGRNMQQQAGNLASSMRMQDYTTQQQLGENAVNRNLQAQQFNAGMTDTNNARNLAAQQFNAGLGESQAARDMQAQQINAGLLDTAAGRRMAAQQFNAGLGESEAARNLQAQQFNSGVQDSAIGRNLAVQQFNAGMGQDWASRNDAMLNNSFARQMQAAQLAPTYGQSAYSDAQQLLNAGNLLQAQQQNLNNEDYQNWLNAQNYNANQLGIMGNALGRSFGGTTTQTGGQGSGLGMGLGTGIAAYAAGMNPYLAGGLGLISMLGR